MCQAEEIDLERLRELAREAAEARSVMLGPRHGLLTALRLIAHCTQANRVHFVCPCCVVQGASWYHMVWYCPARPKVPIPANIFQRRFGWPLKIQAEDSARATLGHLAAAVRLLCNRGRTSG